jgi:hypothetical protein
MMSTSFICKLIVSAVLIAIIGSSLYAQSSAISIGGGYERGEASIQFRDIDSCCREDQFENGIDQAVVTVAYSFKLFRWQRSVFDFRLTWSGSEVLFTTTFPRVITATSGSDYVNESVSFSMQTIQLELLGRVPFTENLSVGIGGVIGSRSIRDYEHWQVSLDESTRPPQHRWHIQDGALESMNHLALGAILTAEYELPLSQRLSLVPELRLTGEVAVPFANTTWYLFSAGGAVSVRYSL